MDISKIAYIWDSGKYSIEVACDRCRKKPAIRLEADCHGDALTLCKEHWVEWFNSELLPAFDAPMDEKWVKVNTAKYGEVYEYIHT